MKNPFSNLQEDASRELSASKMKKIWNCILKVKLRDSENVGSYASHILSGKNKI